MPAVISAVSLTAGPGVCKVRFNAGGRLHVPWGYVGGVQCDPVEKKPFFHVYPGALAYSFGMLGCDLHCSYCQNWVTSQALRDPQAGAAPQDVTPQSLVADAVRQGARLVVSTYNEPLITVEWATAIFKEARDHGLATAFVSNGNGTPRVLEVPAPRTSTPTRSISRASTTAITASSEAASSQSSTPSPGCIGQVSGWRS
jgi:pyruvate formate lyase activating enzyme